MAVRVVNPNDIRLVFPFAKTNYEVGEVSDAQWLSCRLTEAFDSIVKSHFARWGVAHLDVQVTFLDYKRDEVVGYKFEVVGLIKLADGYYTVSHADILDIGRDIRDMQRLPGVIADAIVAEMECSLYGEWQKSAA